MEFLRWMHLVAMAFFVGGQLVLVAAIVPVLRGKETLRLVARRFGWGSLIALGVLLMTGIGMGTENDRFDETLLQVKLGLVALTGGLVWAHMRRPQQHALEGAVFVLSLAIVWLGVALTH